MDSRNTSEEDPAVIVVEHDITSHKEGDTIYVPFPDGMRARIIFLVELCADRLQLSRKVSIVDSKETAWLERPWRVLAMK